MCESYANPKSIAELRDSNAEVRGPNTFRTSEPTEVADPFKKGT